jgi:hypothetical protein
MLLTDLVPEILEDTPHCPEIIIINNMRRIIQDYLRRTRIWEVELNDVSVVTGTKTYTLSAPAQTDAATNSIGADVIALTEMKEGNLETGGDVYEEWVYDASTLTFKLTPVANRTIALKGSLQVSNTSTAAPDFLYTYHSEAITAGTKWRLQRMKDKEWSDTAAAQRNENLYYREVQRGTIHKNSEYGTKELFVKKQDWR